MYGNEPTVAAPAVPEIEPTIRDCSNDDFGTDAPFTEEQLAWIASTLYKPGLPFANRIEPDRPDDSDAEGFNADSDMSEEDDDEEEDEADAEAETAQPEVVVAQSEPVVSAPIATASIATTTPEVVNQAQPQSIEATTATAPVTEMDFDNLLSMEDFPDLNDELFGDGGDVNFADFVNDE